MSPTLSIILFILGIILLLVGLYLSYQSSRSQKTFEDAKQKLDEERSGLERRASKSAQSSSDSSKSASPAPPVEAGLSSAQEEELRKQIGASRDKLGKQRDKNKQITRERDELKKRVLDLESAANMPAHDAHALVDMRMELAEAKQEASLFKQRLAEAEKKQSTSSKSRRKEEEHVEAPVEKPERTRAPEVAATPVDTEDQSAHIHELKERLRQLDHEMQEQEFELRKRLKKQGRDIERQMRRADNNDKAYRITQRELDASRERITMLTEQLERARFAASTTSQVQNHPGLVDVKKLAVSTSLHDTPEEEMTMESPEVTKEIIEQDAAFAEAEDIVSELAGGSSHVEKITQDETPTMAIPVAHVAAEVPAVEEPPVVQETAPVVEETRVEEAPAVEEVVAEEAPVEEAPVVSQKISEAAEASATEVKRITTSAEPAEEGLGEVSAVDEAWGEFDLDVEDDDL